VVEGAPIAYRSGRSGAKQVIVAIGDGNMLVFEIADPNRIVYEVGCVLVRVSEPAAHAVATAATAPGHARTSAGGPSMPSAAGALPQVAAVAPSPPPSTLSRPSPAVCRNTLLDKLGVVSTNQVRAMSDLRFKEAAIEGKVPNTNNLRIDLRGSACDDPRIKATLYDFDANEMLQSITYVWDRPAWPAPAPIFNERLTQLSRFHSLAPPQTTGRLQADTSLGRLILEDLPDRNMLLEAYKAKKQRDTSRLSEICRLLLPVHGTDVASSANDRFAAVRLGSQMLGLGREAPSALAPDSRHRERQPGRPLALTVVARAHRSISTEQSSAPH
jgi:hypothetical protein